MSTTFDPNAAASADSGLFGLTTPLEEAGVVVIGVPFDATASYRKGAHRGPRALLRASRQVDLFDLGTGRPYEAGIAMEPLDERIEAWNAEATVLADQIIAVGGMVAGDKPLERGLARVNAIGAEVNRLVHEKTRAVLARDRLPAIIGGDHSVPFGAIQA
ncbi:MAG TPA: arginase family protein, partial [Planctomycetota bacterium]|nr:arginase family protein [Planctomycetota bacterium]